MAPAPYCWGRWCPAATVHHSTCNNDGRFPSSVQVLIPTCTPQQNSHFASLISFFINHQTADGKSLVPLCVGVVKQGVVVVLVPLLGLGIDQVEKSIIAGHKIEAYHIDEHRGVDATALKNRIEAIDDEEMAITTIMLFISPSSLAKNQLSGKPSPWIQFIQNIVNRGHLSLFCIDEAHYVYQNGRHFRPNFLTAIDSIKTMVESSVICTPMIAMSDTVCLIDQTTLSVGLGVDHPTVIHGPLG